MPVVVTPKLTSVPAVTIWLCGGAVMEGGKTMVKVAAVLVTEPPVLLTTTR